MEMYDYERAVRDDVREYLEQHYTNEELRERLEYRSCRDKFERELYDDLFVEDCVTGNASGSYTFSSWQAEENLCHNQDLLQEAMSEFGCEPSDYKGAEWGDVTIRCYLLYSAISDVLDELENEIEDNEQTETPAE